MFIEVNIYFYKLLNFCYRLHFFFSRHSNLIIHIFFSFIYQTSNIWHETAENYIDLQKS
jgi:hypothetical protein